MPGAYAHITIVNQLREPSRLEKIPGFPVEIISPILKNFKFCEMGAVSPDYPYLAIGDAGAAAWADMMHYNHTVEMIRSGIRHTAAIENENVRGKCIAWLLGYAAHVVTDVTIHPIVQLKVGPYGIPGTVYLINHFNAGIPGTVYLINHFNAVQKMKIGYCPRICR